MKENIIAAGKIYLGKVNRSGDRLRSHGPLACPVYVTWELKDTATGPEFSAQAEAWNCRRTDVFIAGQCLETFKGMMHGNARRILEIWRVWHLNGMKAGTVEQEAELDRRAAIEAPKHPECYYQDGTINFHYLAQKLVGEMSYYTLACQWLNDAGLYTVQHDGKPYAYGSAWLHRSLPDSIIQELKTIAIRQNAEPVTA